MYSVLLYIEHCTYSNNIVVLCVNIGLFLLADVGTPDPLVTVSVPLAIVFVLSMILSLLALALSILAIRKRWGLHLYIYVSMGRETKVFPALAMDVMKTAFESIILHCMNDHCVSCNRNKKNYLIQECSKSYWQWISICVWGKHGFVSRIYTIFIMMILHADCHALFRQWQNRLLKSSIR